MRYRHTMRHEVLKDLTLILIGAVLAYVFARSGLIDLFIMLLGGSYTASFISGIFFTSAFTIAPSTVALASIAGTTSTMSVAFFGALGAMIGDVIMFLFIRDYLAKDIMASIRPSTLRHIMHSLHFGFFKWTLPIVGALVIASPLPNELGLTLMGLSRMRIGFLLPLSFCLNLIGIYSILWLAQTI